LVLAVLFTIVFGTMYTLLQQYGRSSANDAPTQLAESVAAQFKDASNQSTLPLGKLNIATSLQPFVIIYDKNYKPLAGTGYLDGKLPSVDKGVLQHTTTEHNNAVTWEPKSGVRIATVTTKVGDYYVLGGQSLKLTEDRADMLFKLAALGWLVTMVCIVAGYAALNKR
jgi:hypothetical protein